MTSFNFSGNWITWKPKEEQKDELFRLIRNWEKRSTIRKTPHKGEKWQCYYGMRTKQCELIVEVVPDFIFKISIHPETKLIRMFDSLDDCRGQGDKLTEYSIQAIINYDGFGGHADAFWEYFKDGGIWYLHEWERPLEREVLGWRLPK